MEDICRDQCESTAFSDSSQHSQSECCDLHMKTYLLRDLQDQTSWLNRIKESKSLFEFGKATSLLQSLPRTSLMGVIVKCNHCGICRGDLSLKDIRPVAQEMKTRPLPLQHQHHQGQYYVSAA